MPKPNNISIAFQYSFCNCFLNEGKYFMNIFFCRFAIELNEILESERSHLPKTDTRFRPDQRALEVK